MSLLTTLRTLMPHRPLTDDEAHWVAERQASKLRQLSGYADEPFLARDVIAQQPKVQVVADAQLAQSGSSHWTGRVWQITLNAGEPFTRQRYTLAHEYKHIVDAPFIEYAYPSGPGTSAAQRAEAVCDYFAACLLMPKALVVRAFTSGPTLQDPAELARLFGVSPRAMAVRLQALGLTEVRYRCRPAPAGSLGRVRRFYRSAAPTRELLTVGAPRLGGALS
jgi:Zn-dependent peptidase ImmA (M78 family)